MTVAAPPKTAVGAAGDGEFRKTKCGHCSVPVTEVVVGGDVVVVDRRSDRGELRAVRDGSGWRLSRTPGPGVRYSEHRCLEMAAAALGGEMVSPPVAPAARPAGRLAPLATTEGPCVRRCGRRVPNRYGPNAVTVCGECRPA